MFEFAKSRGVIHFRLFAICVVKRPRMFLRDMGDGVGRGGESGESHEAADAIAKCARGTLSLTAMRHADKPEGGQDVHNVRVADGDWGPTKDRNASALLFREAESTRYRHIECANSYRFHGCVEYCMRAPRRGGEKGESPGAIIREC